MARKKPPHDPATAWEPDLDPGDIMHLVSALTLNSNQWLSRFPQSPPRGPSTNWAQQVLAPQAQANHGGIGPAGYATAGGTVCWEDVEVGQGVPFFRIDWGGVSAISGTQQLPSDSIVYTMTDGSSATYDPVSGIITRTSASPPPSPPPSPEEIEETTEVLTGWRVFTIRDYKLRGTWSTWEGRVFHASCNCKEFEESFHGVGGDDSFDLHESRRDDLRRHLAAGIGTCGVYSRKKLNPFWHPDSHYGQIFGLADPQVIARCVNYGLGYEYSGGYRSEYCRIEHLWLLAKGPLEHAPFPDSGFLRHVVPGTPGAVSPETVAQVLSTTYGVPCDVMTPLEFAYKDEEGLL